MPLNITSDQPGAFHAFPSLCGDGRRLWVAWVRWQDGQDSICLRRVEASELSPMWTVSEQPNVNFWPTVTCAPDVGAIVLWARKGKRSWQVVQRAVVDGRLGEEQVLSDERGGWQPSGMVDGKDGSWLAWVECVRHEVLLCQWNGSRSLKTMQLSQGSHCGRPTLRHVADGVLVAWDQYEDGRYEIRGRLVRPDGTMGAVWAISRGADWQLQPQLGQGHDDAPLCCWVTQADVRDPRLMIDQWHSIRCARLEGKFWTLLGDDDAGTVADLIHGLLAKEKIWGYLGRRRHPFLRTDADGRPWLLWERKTQHDGPSTPGQLLGRCWSPQGWGDVAELASGFVFYEVEDRRPDASGQVWAAMRMPAERPAWDIYVAPVALPPTPNQPGVTSEAWTGWGRISLPSALGQPETRPALTVNGREYRLFFGDLHAHSTLSGDAEGEVDEVFRYARDKAALDFVAIVDNDCYQVPLTRSEFNLSLTEAERFNETGRFVTLPGYEWTLWDKARCKHPDHRTVLFPGRADICFATSGSKMVLDFRINGAPMGSEVTASAPIELQVRAWGTRPLENVRIVRGLAGGQQAQVGVVYQVAVSGLHAEVALRDDPPPGTSFYYAIVKQSGADIHYPSNVSIAEGSRAWSSPIWASSPKANR